MFDELKKHIPELIKLKKETIFEARNKEFPVACKSLNASKINYGTEKASFEIDNEYYYIVVNSCWILDSHDDLHVKGIWDDDLDNMKGQNYLVADHDISILTTIVKKEDIEIFIADVPFAALNKSYPGKTQCLIYKFRKDKIILEKAKEWLESGSEIQASVRMMYDEIEFALDSNHPDDKELKNKYDTYYPKIANIEDIDYVYYFFIIKKARNIAESSLVIFGSNSTTGQIVVASSKEQKNIETLQSPQKLKSSLLLI